MEIEVINSWILKGQEVIVELKYIETGLPKGTRLISEQSGNEWIVKGRLIFDHTVENQKRFSFETEIRMHFVFNLKENKELSRQTLLDSEGQGIFQYLIEPFQNDEKPKQFEKLKIKMPYNK